ncbi:hypothetical protein [Paraburkholderia caribensis]|uniref:hypothetical protein n=1 Tax=Paraburkholderia caribensis TaxID=75105 RepID=UPI002858B4F3|nr:hypothetical protein [Paraburkholderia caribensis]MDR6384253.1 hypothetical protein [Paraburkholderia caribensis]
MTNKKGLLGQPREPDPAREHHLASLRIALGHADRGLLEARSMILTVPVSDDYVRALDAIDAARKILREWEG